MLKALSNISGDYASLDAQKQPLEVFCRKGVLRNSAKFTGKHLRQSPLFNKAAGLSSVDSLCFPVDFAKFIRTSFLQNTSGRLLLDVVT